MTYEERTYMRLLGDLRASISRMAPRWPAIRRAGVRILLYLTLTLAWIIGGAAVAVQMAKGIPAMKVEHQVLLAVLIGLLVSARAIRRAVHRYRWEADNLSATTSISSPAFAIAMPPERLPRELDIAKRKLSRTYDAEFVRMVLTFSRLDDPIEVIERRAATFRASLDSRHTLPDERRSRHEAAHAVVAHHAGMAVSHLSIDAAAFSGGRVQSYSDPLMSRQDDHMAQLMFTLAGLIEDRRNGEHDLGSMQDMEAVARLVAALLSIGLAPTGFEGPLTHDSIIAHASTQVDRVLTEYEAQVAEIASRLVEHRRLGHHQVRDQFELVRPL